MFEALRFLQELATKTYWRWRQGQRSTRPPLISTRLLLMPGDSLLRAQIRSVCGSEKKQNKNRNSKQQQLQHEERKKVLSLQI